MPWPLATVFGLTGAVTSSVLRSRRDTPYQRGRQTATKNHAPFSLGLHLKLTRRAVAGPQPNTLEERFSYLDQVLSGNSELLHDLPTRSAQSKPINSHGLSVQTDVLVPKWSSTSFDRHSFPARRRQNFVSIRRILAIKLIQTRCRNDSHPIA